MIKMNSYSLQEFPFFTVVISTRNRGKRVLEAVESILANDYPNFDLWIVDQSDDDLTEQALQPLLTDERLHYVPSMTRGCSSGRNTAIRLSKGEFIAITDDDCVVPINWLRTFLEAFQSNPKIAVVNGNVLAGEHDATAGYITVYQRKAPFLAQNLSQKNAVRGITANMGLRRSAWEKVQGFDQMLGVGAPLRSASEGDFMVKILMKGYYVYETPKLTIIHNGFRNWSQYRKLSAQYAFGNGAVVAKYLKIKPGVAWNLFLGEFGVLVQIFLKNVIFRRRLNGFTPLLAFWGGVYNSLRTPVDRYTGNYRAKS